MGERIQDERSTSSKREVEAQDVRTDSKEDLKADLDALLDEVDSVLEENAEEFVNAYIQKGGE